MASEYCTRWSSNAATLMRQRFCSVLISYSSPTATCLEALTASPLYLILPLSHASAACDLVLKRRIDQRYLSMRSFSFSAIMKGKIKRILWLYFTEIMATSVCEAALDATCK